MPAPLTTIHEDARASAAFSPPVWGYSRRSVVQVAPASRRVGSSVLSEGRRSMDDEAVTCCSWYYRLIGWPYSVIALGFTWVMFSTLLWIRSRDGSEHDITMQFWLKTALVLLVLAAAGFVAVSACFAHVLNQHRYAPPREGWSNQPEARTTGHSIRGLTVQYAVALGFIISSFIWLMVLHSPGSKVIAVPSWIPPLLTIFGGVVLIVLPAIAHIVDMLTTSKEIASPQRAVPRGQPAHRDDSAFLGLPTRTAHQPQAYHPTVRTPSHSSSQLVPLGLQQSGLTYRNNSGSAGDRQWRLRNGADGELFSADDSGGDRDPITPKGFLCPLTKQLLIRPVLAGDGYTYERAAIQSWLELNGSRSPLTGQPMSADSLRPRSALRKEIKEWKKSQCRQPDIAELAQVDVSCDMELCCHLGSEAWPVDRCTFRGRPAALCAMPDAPVSHLERIFSYTSIKQAEGQECRLLRYIGLWKDTESKSRLVTEAIPHGTLSTALQDLLATGQVEPVSQAVQLKVAIQVCEAMQALTKAGVAHGDLCLANILPWKPFDPNNVSSVDMKVSAIYLPHYDALLSSSLRTLSPETITNGTKNEATDVWAFGVCMWQIASLGMRPYPDVAEDNDVKAGVCEGKLRLKPPQGMDLSLWGIVEFCTHFRPEDRPTFDRVHVALHKLALAGCRNALAQGASTSTSR